ncbi:putative Calmodulin A [Hyalella azteca]|uniref:Calmodulin-like n=1 Tax=Hyalella azteca TaxID=294128 RepID=A0A6A0GTN2_HYAAZ|nr:calmodulin-like [Hyalella azteca]KAA0187132.1 putative Calmodulin A [Hyalella azteca]
MAHRLGAREIESAKECFAIYSINHKLPRNNLGKALRSLGANPSNQDLQQMIAKMRVPDPLSLQDFLSVLEQDFPPPDSEEEIREAFGVFDKDGEGTISASELKHVLMTMGEKLTQEEVELIVREADVDEEGQIRYEQFVSIMKRN